MSGPINWMHTFFDALTYDIPKKDFSKLRKKNVQRAREDLESLLAVVPGATSKDVQKLTNILYFCEQGNWSKLKPEYVDEARQEYNRLIRSLQPNADAPRPRDNDYGGNPGNPGRYSPKERDYYNSGRDYDQRRDYPNQNDYGARDYPPTRGAPYRDEGYGSRQENRQGARMGNRLLVPPTRVNRKSHHSDDKEVYISGENKLPGLLLNTDVSDSEKSTAIAKMFVDLFDFEWGESLEVLIHTMKEQKAIEILKDILVEADKQCQSIANRQLQTMAHAMETAMFFPFGAPKGLEGAQSHIPVHVKDLFLARKIPRDVKEQGLKGATEYRKAAAAISVPVKTYEVGQKLQGIAQSDSIRVHNYISRCISVLWMMAVQDPPLCIYWPQGSSFDSHNFYEYTDKGSYVDFAVWPALRLYEGGPLLAKGVVKCK